MIPANICTNVEFRFHTTPIQYKVKNPGAGDPIEVKGFAVNMPGVFNELKVCLRFGNNEWVVDHYPTGICLEETRQIAEAIGNPFNEPSDAHHKGSMGARFRDPTAALYRFVAVMCYAKGFKESIMNIQRELEGYAAP